MRRKIAAGRTRSSANSRSRTFATNVCYTNDRYSSECYCSRVENARVDAYVIDSLMPDLVGHDRKPSAFIVFLFLWRRTLGVGRPSVNVSLQMIADGTGLSKGAIQGAIQLLKRRELLQVTRKSPTAIPTFAPKC